MTISEKLQASKDELMNLLEQANNTTGKTDANISSAIQTLCDGYGQGESEWQRPAEWPPIPNDYLTDGYYCYYLVRYNDVDTPLDGNTVSIPYIGTTDQDGNFTVVKQYPAGCKVIPASDAVGLGEYYWIRVDGRGRNAYLTVQTRDPSPDFKVVEVLLGSSSPNPGEFTYSAFTADTEHIMISNVNIAYNYLFYNNYSLRLVELVGCTIKSAMFNGTVEGYYPIDIVATNCVFSGNGSIVFSSGSMIQRRPIRFLGDSFGNAQINVSSVYGGLYSQVFNQELAQRFLDQFDLTKQQDIANLFTQNMQVEEIHFNTAFSGTSASGMFDSCNKLRVVDFGESDFRNVVQFNFMFRYCSNMRAINIPSSEDIRPTQMYQTFYACRKTASIDLRNFDFSATTNLDNMVDECYALENIYFSQSANIQANIGFTYCQVLSHESLVGILNALGNVSTTHTCRLGATNKSKLTPDEIAVATQKGWTVA